jgi:hypothetical protein
MPVSVYWVDEAQTIIRRDHIGEWTVAEVEQSTYDIEVMSKSMQHTFHLIFNFTDSRTFPTKVLAAARGASQSISPYQGLVIAVKMPMYLQALAHIAGRIYPKLAQNTFLVDTIEAAYALIDEYKTRHPQP